MNKSFILCGFVVCTAFGSLACGDDAGTSSGGSTGSGDGGSGGESATTTTGGVGGSNDGGGGGAAQATVALTLDPTTVAAGDTVEATVTVTNFVFEAPSGQPNEEGHGHYHLYLDDAVGGDYLASAQSPTVTFTMPADTAPGPHTVRISLGDHDHGPVNPPVEDIVDITVE
jgi:hypothetical protein